MFISILNKNKVISITLISLVWIILYKFLFLKTVEFFDGCFILGELTYNVALAIIGSSIFYYFVVYLKEEESKARVSKVINKRFLHLISTKDLIYKDIISKTSFENPPKILPNNNKLFIEICKDIKLSDKPPLNWNGSDIQLETWFDYFEFYFELDKYNIDILYNYSQYLNDETMERLDEVGHTTFHSGIRQYKFSNKEYANKLESLGGALWYYLNTLSKFTKDSWR